MNPFPTRQHAENYIARLPAEQQAAMRHKLGLETSPPAQTVPVQGKQLSGLNTLPPPRKVVHSQTAEKPRPTQAMRTLGSENSPVKGSLFLSLPYPPSMNAIWRAVVIMVRGKAQARVLLSQQGRQYRKSVQNIIRSLGSPKAPAGARLELTLTVYPPDRRARDLSNIPKALEDALTHAQVWADDSLIDVLHIYRGDVVRGGRVDAVIAPMTSTLFEGHL